MANEEYTDYIVDQLAELGTVNIRKMFGGMGLYLEGVMFALITSEGVLYFRIDDTNQVDYTARGMTRFGATDKNKGMPYCQVPHDILDDDEELTQWARIVHQVAVVHKKN